MKNVAFIALLVALLVLGCSSQLELVGRDADAGAGNGAGNDAAPGSSGAGAGNVGAGNGGAGGADGGAAGMSGSGTVAGSGGLGGSSGMGGAGGVGAVPPHMSTGGAAAPFEVACQFDGIDYELGEAIASIDGCNECMCGMSGIECSDRPCRGQSSADGDAQDGDAFMACEDYEDCPAFDCPCGANDLDCLQPCINYACVSGICVNRGSRTCTPADTSACLDNEFCDFALEDACGTASAGDCSLIFNERRCTQDVSAACGCDGVSYQNACIARAAGQSISPANMCD